MQLEELWPDMFHVKFQNFDQSHVVDRQVGRAQGCRLVLVDGDDDDLNIFYKLFLGVQGIEEDNFFSVLHLAFLRFIVQGFEPTTSHFYVNCYIRLCVNKITQL